MAYLSKVMLNPLRLGAQKLLTNPQAMHAAVLGGIPPGTDGRVLWREETVQRTGGPVEAAILIQTPAEPDWSHLIEQAGWQTEAGRPLVRPLDPLLDLVVTGRRFQFRLRANPVQALLPRGEAGSKPTVKGRRGKRQGVGRAELQLEWFLKRTVETNAPWGFEVERNPDPTVQLVGRDRLTFTKGSERHRVMLDRATFAGELTVTDASLLRQTILSGIGSGKAYGCGLLTLAPGAGDVVAG